MWRLTYDPGVEGDLSALGNAGARRVLRAIFERLVGGTPDKIGKPLKRGTCGL